MDWGRAERGERDVREGWFGGYSCVHCIVNILYPVHLVNGGVLHKLPRHHCNHGRVLCLAELAFLQHESRSWKWQRQSRSAEPISRAVRLEQTSGSGTEQSRVAFRRLEDCKEQ